MVISGDIRILSLATTILSPSHSSNKLTQTCLAPQNVTVRVGDTPPCHPCVLRQIRESNGREAQTKDISRLPSKSGLGDMNFQQIGESIDPNISQLWTWWINEDVSKIVRCPDSKPSISSGIHLEWNHGPVYTPVLCVFFSTQLCDPTIHCNFMAATLLHTRCARITLLISLKQATQGWKGIQMI